MLDTETQDDLRAAALASLKKKRDFRAHIAAYVLINGFLVAIWAMTGAHFFWPVFPMLGWGIGVFFNAWDVYGHQPTEEDVQREMQRMR
jgi:hypothetical protein